MSETTEYVLMGGPQDGQILQIIVGTPFVEIRVYKTPSLLYTARANDSKDTYNSVRYNYDDYTKQYLYEIRV